MMVFNRHFYLENCYNNVTSIVKKDFLSPFDNHAFPWIDGLAAGQQNHFIVITLYQQQPSSHSNLHIKNGSLIH